MIIDRSNLDHLFKGFSKLYQKGFARAQPLWNKVAVLVPSATETESYAWLNEVPRLREWIGERALKDIVSEGYQITNKHYEGSVSVNRNKIDDDTYGIYAPIIEELGYSAATWPDDLVFNLLKKGFSETCFDGQFFFDADHPVGPDRANPVSLVSNFQAGTDDAWYLLDTSRAIKPLIYQERKKPKLTKMDKDTDEAVFTRNLIRYGVDMRCNAGFGFWQMAYASKAALNPTNFKAARKAMRALKSDEGRPLGVQPRLLVVGSSNEDAAEELVRKERLASGETNVLRGSVEVLVSPWLD